MFLEGGVHGFITKGFEVAWQYKRYMKLPSNFQTLCVCTFALSVPANSFHLHFCTLACCSKP